MNVGLSKIPERSCILRCCLLLLCALASAPAWPACPKLLMSAGLNFRKQTDARDAAYWGHTVGVQGFLVNYMVSDWQTDVGTNPDSGLWKLASRFQSLYSGYGVTDNFIKISIFKPHDWNSEAKNQAIVKNMAHAAALARFARLKGVALDLEPYKPTWGGAAGGPKLARTVEQVGRDIGNAMHAAYPDMTLMVLPDALREVEHERTLPQDWAARHNGGYGLSAAFVRGLLSVQWAHVVMATEYTYSVPPDRIVPSVQEAAQRYQKLDVPGVEQARFSVAPGLWPLGPSRANKSARETPERFKQRLEDAYKVSRQYVWIYGSNSAWQANGPLGPVPGPVAPDFQQFVDAIHQVQASCPK